ncbi:IclR family transcriptional regulator domain-containing protein [Amycolatopsis dongchuanensis]|uniref:IclR family transcriptional regulator n=1 Tax=Amycolatopsis dongchuanensis TaxID=1070866 RepID=A0ABP9QR96_9PSEU
MSSDTRPANDRTRPSPPSEGMAGLAKGLAVIEAFGAERTQMTVTEAARAVSLSPAAARRCLLTLTELGYLVQEDRYFRPTPRMMRLGEAYLEGATLPTLARPFVEAGRDELGESMSLAVYDEGTALFVARAEVHRIVSTGVRLGARLPAYASATGRVLLAGLPEEERERYLRTCEPRRTTPHSVTTIPEIRDRIEAAAAEGFAVTDEELELGMRSMAVPVVDSAGRVHAAMSTSVFVARVTMEEMRRRYLPVLRAQAAALGRLL